MFVCFRDIDDRYTDHVPLRFHHISLRAFVIQLEAFSLQVSKDEFCSFLEEGFTYLWPENEPGSSEVSLKCSNGAQ